MVIKQIYTRNWCDKKLLKLLIFSFLGFQIVSCSKYNENKPSTIEIDIDQTDSELNPIIVIKSFSPVESDKYSYFGDIEKMEYFQGKFYLFDPITSMALFVFSNDGKFLNKTKIGEGPTEIELPTAFFIDKFERNIAVYDMAGFLNTYSLDLNFISKKRYTNDLPINDFEKVNNTDTLVISHQGIDDLYTIWSSNKKLNNKSFIKDFNYNGVQSLSRHISTSNKTFLVAPFDYHVYNYDDGEISKEIYFDFGNKKTTQDDIIKHGISGCWRLIRSGERVSSITEIATNSDFLLFHVYYRNEAIFYVYSFNKGILYNLNHYFENGLLPKSRIRGITNEGLFFATVQSDELAQFKNLNKSQLPLDLIMDKNEDLYIMTFTLSE